VSEYQKCGGGSKLCENKKTVEVEGSYYKANAILKK
jgi:hypothetical protein